MTKQSINLFMWGYQEHLRISLALLTKRVLTKLGAEVEVESLLVGVRTPGSKNRNAVCIEPEDGRWPLSAFAGIEDAVEAINANHDLQNMFYGDEPSNRDKPDVMRRDSVRTAVLNALDEFDRASGMMSFYGTPHRVDDFHVVPIIQVPSSLFQKYPPLERLPKGRHGTASGPWSFIHSAIATILAAVSGELKLPEPGRHFALSMTNAEEIARTAATRFMYGPGNAISEYYCSTDLFARLNLVSSLLYEGAQGVGRLLFANPRTADINLTLAFNDPVPLSEPRWARKVLQIAGTDTVLVADSERIYGLGQLGAASASDVQDVFTVDFLDHYTWELSCEEIPLLRSHYGLPSLPKPLFEKVLFVTNLERLFPDADESDRERLWALLNAAGNQKSGSMIVIASDAAEEGKRLKAQGTSVSPVPMSVELFRQASRIDGSILLDPHGNCHAIGVILDGAANSECTPSRGSRFNSAVRYVHRAPAQRLAVVVSDDRTVDIFPVLRPNVSRLLLEQQINELVAANSENYHKAMNWLSARRFYLNARQCTQINDAISRIRKLPHEGGEIRYFVGEFAPDPNFNDTYLSD